MKINILQDIMSANDRIAAKNQQLLEENQVIAINIMSSPGAGKTTLLLETLRRLKSKFKMAVIEADIASTVDAERIIEEGVPATQINTGGECHIDANMLSQALSQVNLKGLDLLFIENVGNLVCPAEFRLGVTKSIMLLSVPEGHDKPYKYPLMFTTTDAILVSKMDYLPLSDFDMPLFKQVVSGMNPKARIIPISAKTGQGMPDWIDWLESLLEKKYK